MKALVVFQDEGRHWLSPLLQRGFRHVSVVVSDGTFWIGVDPRLGVPRIEVVAAIEYDLAANYREDGLTVVETETVNREPVWPFALSNCVSVVKCVLGINAPFVVTPLALYRRLTK